ncbi:MAG: membrane-bound lytic murein transglycosylase MltF [Desulfobacteraceae bacterium]|nr:membrane-bound lytic murein transglycosylase MltF [Desulfobacteraceae bacterium]
MLLTNSRIGCTTFAACLVFLFLCGCDQLTGAMPSRSLAEIKNSGKLVVLTRNAPTTYYIDQTGRPTGPEYDLVESFAEFLGVEAEYRICQTIDQVLSDLEEGKGDLAAAGLSITEAREKKFRFSPPYQEITPQVVTRRDRIQPESLEDLLGIEIVVIASSSYVERLTRLKDTQYPDLQWEEAQDQSTEQLLFDVWAANIDCTIADSNIVDINRRYYPQLIAPINLGRAQELGWAMAPRRRDLARAIAKWMKDFEQTGQMDHVHEKYYGFFEAFDYVDTMRYLRRIQARFPKYREYFRKAAEKYDLPFDLLAAQAYQESHWNPHAVSPTGVRGIMMLTLATAREMGVSNRLDPRQSIFGGAKYLARLKKRFSEKVTEPDLTWLALAAYNVGRGHLHDAQVLARQFGLNPHSWRDLKQVLPLLADKQYYKDLKYGYARGYEPVRYVKNIREYQHILRNDLNNAGNSRQVSSK